MPRKTKEQKELENNKKIEKAIKKTTNKKVATEKKSTTTKKKDTAKKATKTTKSTTKKAVANSKTKTATTSKAKTSIKKATTKKAVSKKSTSSNKKKVEIVEYYDLPYRYNQTVVKVLAQTPNTLFIYWDISDKDRKNFEQQYGNNFFETTKPILIIYNDTLGYRFEVEINDFANSWYLRIADSKCDYRIELGRRPIARTEKLQNTDYIYITTSNKIESPNDRVLLDRIPNLISFRNIKTGEVTKKPLTSCVSLIKNSPNQYNIYDLYHAIYRDENIEEIYGNPSSGSLSSKFK